MAKPRKSWREKLADDKDLPKIVELEGKAAAKWGEGRMVIPAPREVDALMKKIPRGKLITSKELREKLARKHKADMTCPITTGIFAWIAAGAADEAARDGEADEAITPFWRTLKAEGELNPKYPGGLEEQRARLEAEGHKVVPRGRSKVRFVVDQFEQSLVS
ncbi:MAG: MGMT family protein [Verrucomicrobiota bacterium]